MIFMQSFTEENYLKAIYKLVEQEDDAVTTNDEFHSPDRHRLVTTVKRLIAAHTRSTADEWEITFTSTGSEAMDLALQLIYLDGFNLAYALTHETFIDAVELLVPELQKRGVYKTEYAQGTLREKLFGGGARLGANHPGASYRDLKATTL